MCSLSVRIVRRHDNSVFDTGHEFHQDRVIHLLRRDNAEIDVHLTGTERPCDFVSHVGSDLQLERRICLLQNGKKSRDTIQVEDGARADPEHRQAGRGYRRNFLQALTIFVLNAQRPLQKHLARRGQFHAAPVTLKQNSPNLMFKVGNAFGNGRLRQRQLVTGRRQGAVTGNGQKCSHVLVHVIFFF